MQYIGGLITLLLGLSQFFLKIEKKICILIAGAICFDCFSFSELSIAKFETFVCFCFFLSELKYFEKRIKILRNTNIISLINVVTCGAIVCIVTSPHLRSITSIAGFIVSDLIAKYFVICYGFIGLTRIKDIKDYLRVAKLCLLILTFFAILNFLLARSPWIELFKPEVVGDMIVGDRLRLNSMFIYTFDYGQTCIVILLTFLYGLRKKIYAERTIYLCIGFCLFGIIMSGSRSILATGLLSVLIFFSITNSFRNNIKLYSRYIVLLLPLILLVPAVNEKMMFLLSALDTNSTVAGSSANMRIIQYLTVISIIQASYIFGMGYQYFFIDLGWSSGLDTSRMLYPELAGLEGALMSILLERGIFGCLVYIIFYGGLIITALKLRKYDKEASAAATSILVSFVLFGNMTGELNSAVICLLFSGFFMRICYLSKQIKLSNGNGTD